MAYQEARLAKIKTEKGELTRMRELSKEEVAKLKKDKEAYKNRQKLELTEIRDVKSAHTEKLKKEKLAYKEAQRAKLSNEERLARVREIETPKPPRSPLDHVVDMAKKDAKFYLEGKEISSDEAIKALKENKHLNIQTLDSSSKQPKVYISKNPIIIEN
jgi:NACalpha-BTF3-like transcription factor